MPESHNIPSRQTTTSIYTAILVMVKGHSQLWTTVSNPFLYASLCTGQVSMLLRSCIHMHVVWIDVYLHEIPIPLLSLDDRPAPLLSSVKNWLWKLSTPYFYSQSYPSTTYTTPPGWALGPKSAWNWLDLVFTSWCQSWWLPIPPCMP